MVFMRLRKTSQLAAKSGPRAPKGVPGEAQEAPRTVQERSGEAQEPPRAAPEAHGSGPGTSLEGPGAARERPRSGPRDPEAPRRAQKGSPDAKTFGFTRLSGLLAEVFKRSVKPNQGFRGVDAPKTRNLQGFLTAQASLSSLLGVLVEARARPATQTKTLFEITGRKVFRDSCGTDVHWPVSTTLSD